MAILQKNCKNSHEIAEIDSFRRDAHRRLENKNERNQINMTSENGNGMIMPVSPMYGMGGGGGGGDGFFGNSGTSRRGRGEDA